MTRLTRGSSCRRPPRAHPAAQDAPTISVPTRMATATRVETWTQLIFFVSANADRSVMKVSLGNPPAAARAFATISPYHQGASGKPLAAAQTPSYNGAGQSWEMLMDDEGPIGSKRDNVTFPWLAAYPPGVPARIETPPYGLLGEIAPDLAAREPAARAFTTIIPNRMAASLSFAQIDLYSDAFAAYLRETLHLEPGARVAIQIPNGLAYPVAAFGIFKAGCVLVNVNPLYTAHEMAHVFADAELSAIVAIDMFAGRLAAAMEQVPVPHVILTEAASLFPIASRRLIGFVQKYVKKQVPYPHFRHAVFSKALAVGTASIRTGANVKGYTSQMEPSAVACLQYTGGTTGESKGAMLTHRNLIMNVAQFVSFWDNDMRESDHVLTALPLYHIFAFTVNFLGFFIRGAHNILIPSPRPLSNLRKAFQKEAITVITGVNTLFNGLLNQLWFCENPPRSLRISDAGGMALQEAVAVRWRKTTGTDVIEGYGLSEASPVLTCNPVGRAKLGSIGVPLPSTEMKCVDDQGTEAAIGAPGEIIAHGPQVMQGYWKQPEETKRDGWLFTADIGKMD